MNSAAFHRIADSIATDLRAGLVTREQARCLYDGAWRLALELEVFGLARPSEWIAMQERAA